MSRAQRAARVRGLYGIADGTFRPEVPLLDKLDALLRGGCQVVQLRMKTEAAGVVLARCREAVPRCRAAGALCLVNDRADLAVLSDADGVHVGQEDLPVRDARALVGPDRLVGATVRTLAEALAAAADGADYVGFGPLFGTTTKDVKVSPRGLAMLAEVVRGCPIPVIAIGGIDLARIGEVARAGAAGAAVVSAALGPADAAAATRALAAAFEEGRS